MKISMFHLMPYRELPADFEKRYHSVWVDPPYHELADTEKIAKYYNWTLDELTYAAKAGMDGICVNEHHQNAYGFMPSPNLMGSALARATNDLDVALVQMGATLPTTIPPIRVAEEYGMLDCISGGRLVAGMPLGTPMDANLCYGITPMEHRERYYEAHDLIMKAWQSKEIFAWNGKYFKLPMVNLWPRPLQKPHPPVWIPGSGSLSTWDFTAKHNHCYCFLSYYGNNLGKRVMDGFWEFVAKSNLDANPYRAGFLQLVVVAESDAKAEELYYPHIRYFYDKCLHILWDYQADARQPGPSQSGQQRQESVPDAARPDVEGAELEVQGFRREPVRDRRQPQVGDRPAQGRGQEAARGQLDGAVAHWIDAARADAQEHRYVRARGQTALPRHVGRRVGEPVVARAAEGKEARSRASGRRASHDGACGEVDSARRALAPPARPQAHSKFFVSPAPARPAGAGP